MNSSVALGGFTMDEQNVAITSECWKLCQFENGGPRPIVAEEDNSLVETVASESVAVVLEAQVRVQGDPSARGLGYVSISSLSN